MYKESNGVGELKFKTDRFPKEKLYMQVEEQELPPLFPSDTEPVSDLRMNQGIEMGG